MLEIIFNGIGFVGCITLLMVFIYQERKAEKKRHDEYYDKLSESISVGVYSALVRFENFKGYLEKKTEIERKM